MDKYDLPLKIVHGFDFSENTPDGEVKQGIRQRLLSLKEKGFGGIVTNVSFINYLESERAFEILGFAMGIAKELDMRVWLYDEHGYPSGGAGGLTLKADPDFECRGVVMIHAFLKPGERRYFEFPRGHEYALSAFSYKVASEDITGLDADDYYKKYDVYKKTDGLEIVNDTNGLLFVAYFVKKRVYEGTHAQHNVFECRRYIDITNKDAVAEFIKNTYEAYDKRFSREYSGQGGIIEAMFTDEPSLMGVYINAGLYPPHTRDPYDDTLPLYPVTTWGKNIDNRVMTLYGIDVYKYLIYLFAADTEKAQGFRRVWYGQMSKLAEEAYYQQISDHCCEAGLPFSGHILLEDDIRLHPTFEGNYFSLLRHMHYPGIDMLQSLPETVYNMSFTPKLISSIARAYGREHVMSEVSAHAQGGRVTDEQMLCSQLLQYAFGVDVFTSYYSENMMQTEKYKKYNEIIGNVASRMRGRDTANVAVYYPYDCVSSNTVVAIPGLVKDGDSAKRRDDCSDQLMRNIKILNDRQIGYNFIDLELIENCKTEDGKIKLPSGVKFDTLFITPCALSEREVFEINRLSYNGVKVYYAEDGIFPKNESLSAETVSDAKALPEDDRFTLEGDREGVASLLRDTGDGLMLLLVNSENKDKRLIYKCAEREGEISLSAYGYEILKIN